MVQYKQLIILSLVVISLSGADQDDDGSRDKKRIFPSLQYIVQKSIAKKIEHEQDSLVLQLRKSLKIHDGASWFTQALDRVKLVDVGIKSELPALLIPGCGLDPFNVSEIIGKNKDLAVAVRSVCMDVVRRDTRLSKLFDCLVSYTNNELKEENFDDIYLALMKSPSWILDELVNRLNLDNSYQYTHKETSRSVKSASALHVSANSFFISGCLNKKQSRKVQSISLESEQENILPGNDCCVTRFFSQGNFLFGCAPYKSGEYDNTHLYIWDMQTRGKCQDLSVPGKIVGSGLSGRYCVVVDSFGVVNCFVKKDKSFFSCCRTALKCSIVSYAMLPHVYAYVTDKKTVVIGSLDCSSAKPVFSDIAHVDCDVSTLFFLSDTELLACRNDKSFYITIDSETKKTFVVEHELKAGDVAKGMIVHGKFVYPRWDAKALAVFDPRMNVYGYSISGFYDANIFAVGENTVVAYDDEMKKVWLRKGIDLKSLLVSILATRDRFNLQGLLSHSNIINDDHSEWQQGWVEEIPFAVKLLYRLEMERISRAALGDPMLMLKEPK